MPTPKAGYYNKAGKRLIGTTTLISRFKDSGALIKWAYKMGREHEGLARSGHPAPNDLYEVTSEAANIGTATHQMVELAIDGADPFSSTALVSLATNEQRERATKAYHNYVRWSETNKLTVVAQEMMLVSEQYQYGGTPDAIGEVNGQLCLLDWKTSNSVYSDYLIQLAAYKQLWEENNPGKPLVGGAHLLRFSKDYGDFAHHFFDDLSEAWELFKLYLPAYRLDQSLRKRL
jgi:hypothetical protein